MFEPATHQLVQPLYAPPGAEAGAEVAEVLWWPGAMSSVRGPTPAPAARAGDRAMARSAACILLAAALALSARAAAAQSVRVEFEGVEGAAKQNVEAVVAIARAAGEGAELSPARVRQLHRDAPDQIRLALQPFGFYDPAVRGRLEPEDGDWRARYLISPGPPVVLRSVDLRIRGDGAASPAFRRLLDEFALSAGDTLRHLPYDALKLELLTVASDSGFLEARFDSAAIYVDVAADTARMVLAFDTGPRFRFGPVRFDRPIVDPDLLATRIPFERGDPYAQPDLLEFQSRLAEDPWVRSAEVIPEPERAAGLEVPIEVRLVPRKSRAYEVGVGYGTDDGPRGTLGVRWRRLNRRGHHAEAELIASTLQQGISTTYTIPAVLHPTGALAFVAGYAALNPEVSSTRTWILGARLSRTRFGWDETFGVHWQRSAFEIGSDSTSVTLLSGRLGYQRTESNNPIYPTRGWRVRAQAEGGLEALLSSVSFLHLSAGGKLIRSLGARARVLARADVGRVFANRFERLPPAQRFFAGGDESVRAYRLYAIGPVDEEGDAIGGSAMLAGSLELDYRVLERWGLAVFTDAGNASNRFSTRLQHSAGVGIRWLSPVGFIRLDGAFTLNAGPSVRSGAFRLHFRVGPDL